MSGWDVDTVFLDRDGTINVKPDEGDYVKHWREFRFLPGVPEAIRRLKQAGMTLVVVSNQRGVALGRMTAGDVSDVNRRMQEALGGALDGVYVCPHERDSCDCRKPEVGLFLQARHDLPAIDFARSVVIGDSAADMEAGRRLGMRRILVAGEPRPGADVIAASLADAVPELLRRVRATSATPG